MVDTIKMELPIDINNIILSFLDMETRKNLNVITKFRETKEFEKIKKIISQVLESKTIKHKKEGNNDIYYIELGHERNYEHHTLPTYSIEHIIGDYINYNVVYVSPPQSFGMATFYT